MILVSRLGSLSECLMLPIFGSWFLTSNAFSIFAYYCLSLELLSLSNVSDDMYILDIS